MKAYAYSKTSAPVEFIGKFEAVIETKKRMSVATFFVVKAKHCGNLLSLNTAQELGLVSLHLNKLTSKDPALFFRSHPSKALNSIYGLWQATRYTDQVRH